MENYAEMGLSELAKLPGVSDLPMSAKVKFIKALKAESAGDHEEAEQQLAAAVEAEQHPVPR